MALLTSLAASMLRESPLSLALLLLAVASGVGFQMPNVANLAGYRQELLKQEVSTGNGHVRVRPKDGDRFSDASAFLSGIRELEGVAAVQRVLNLPAAARNRGKFTLTQITAIDPRATQRPYELAGGGHLAPNETEGVLMGTNLARRMGVGVGDTIELDVLLSTRPRLVLDDEGVGHYVMTVRGLVGAAGVDRLFGSLPFLANEVGEDEAATMMVVYAHDPSVTSARRIAAAVEARFPEARAKSWFDDSHLIRSSVGAIDAVGTIADLMSLLAVGVPVLALLYIDALNRRRQVSLLAAMGLRAKEIFGVFVFKALFVGVVGVLIGGLIGAALIAYFDTNPIYDYEKFVIRPALSLWGVLAPMLLVLGATVLAGSYPAFQAARVDPSRMLRRIE